MRQLLRPLEIVICCASLFVSQAFAAEFFVSPSATSSGNGTATNPWSLSTALAHPSAIKSGDTLWLFGGRYGTGGSFTFSSRLTGTATSPIILRQISGQRAIIDGSIEVRGSHTYYWGFELTNSTEKREVTDDERPRGIIDYGRGNKFINLIINNSGRTGIGFHGLESEVYGCIFWGNGIYDVGSGGTIRGSSIYANVSSSDPALTSTVSDTISFRNFNLGVKVYTKWTDHFINGFYVDGNISFDNPQYNIVIKDEVNPIKRLTVTNNVTYQRPTSYETSFFIGGYVDSEDAVIKNNYVVSGRMGYGSLDVRRWKTLVLANNTLIGFTGLIGWTPSSTISNVIWNENLYYGGSSTAFKLNGIGNTFSNWKQITTFDSSSSYFSSMPTSTKVMVRPNAYEQGRGHIVIYNPTNASTIAVDLSTVLERGQSFEIRDAQNFWGAPVFSSVFDGSASNESYGSIPTCWNRYSFSKCSYQLRI